MIILERWKIELIIMKMSYYYKFIHPFINKLYNSCNEDKTDPKFKRAAYEVAAFEFACAVAVLQGKSNYAEDSSNAGIYEVQNYLTK